MSVAETACYRDDAFHAVTRVITRHPDYYPYLAKLLDFDVGGVKDVSQNIVTEPGNLMKQVLEGKVKMRDLIFTKGKQRFHELTYLLEKHNNYVFGLPAVYRVAAKLLDRAKNKAHNVDFQQLHDIFLVGEVIGNRTPKDAKFFIDHSEKLVKEELANVHQIFASLLKVANGFSKRGYKLDLSMADYPRPLDVPEVSHLGFDACYPAPGLLLIEHNGELIFLTRNDIDRVERILKGFSLAKTYSHVHSYLTPDERNEFVVAVSSYIKILQDRMRKISFEDAQLLCRACDVIYFNYLASHSVDVTVRALQDQQAKYRDENLAKILPMENVLNLVRMLPMREALEVLQVYKALPAPDFDPYGATQRQADLYSKQNTITDYTFFGLVMRYHKFLMIKAFHSRHHYCPGKVIEVDQEPEDSWYHNYPHCHPDHIKLEQIDLIDLKGSFIYEDHTHDVFDLLKDKAICPDFIDVVKNEGDLQSMDRTEKNYLLNVATKQTTIDLDKLRKNYDKLFMDIKCEDKAEAKKPNGRWFMEAGSEVRLVLSEYEQSIAAYGTELEGFMQGKGIIEKSKMMNFVTEYFVEANDEVPTYVSFDIAKFSPRLPLEVHQALDEHWAEAFGIPELAHMSRIYTEGKLHYVKHGVHASFAKRGNDFEGFFGRKLTFYHLAVMHAARKVLTDEGITGHRYRFAAQIDDGLMRLNVKKGRHNDLLDRLNEIWLAAGMEISWDKTFVSKYLSVFLNEVRVQGRAIGNAMRAVVKIRNHEEGVVPSIVDDLNCLEATVRGAYIAGMTPKAGYLIYSYLVADTVQKWGGHQYKYRPDHICWYFAPRNLGGLGLCNSQTMLGPLDYDSLSTGIANLKLIALRDKTTVKNINMILSQRIRHIGDLSQVSNPVTFRREDPIFRGDRLKISLKMALGNFDRFPMVKRVLTDDAITNAEGAAVHVANSEMFPVEARILWYESTVLAAYDSFVSKVLTVATARYILPKRALFRITAANVHEAKQLIRKW